jgi:hypothetical protein
MGLGSFSGVADDFGVGLDNSRSLDGLDFGVGFGVGVAPLAARTIIALPDRMRIRDGFMFGVLSWAE